MNQKPTEKERPKTKSKVEPSDLAPKKDPKGGATLREIPITKPIDKGTP